MPILVTGSSGHLGSTIESLLKHVHSLIGIDINPGKQRLHVGSITDRQFVAERIKEVEAVINTVSFRAPHVLLKTEEEFNVLKRFRRRSFLYAGEYRCGPVMVASEFGSKSNTEGRKRNWCFLSQLNIAGNDNARGTTRFCEASELTKRYILLVASDFRCQC